MVRYVGDRARRAALVDRRGASRTRRILIEQMLGFSANAIPPIWALVIEPEIANNGFVWPPQ